VMTGGIRPNSMLNNEDFTAVRRWTFACLHDLDSRIPQWENLTSAQQKALQTANDNRHAPTPIAAAKV